VRDGETRPEVIDTFQGDDHFLSNFHDSDIEFEGNTWGDRFWRVDGHGAKLLGLLLKESARASSRKPTTSEADERH
jgi:hypothetical protein